MGLPAVLALAGLTTLIPPAAAAQQHFPAESDLELMIRYLVEDGEAPGMVLGVLEPDGSTKVVSYGSAGEAASHELGPGSVFEIGSITKTFTATLLADMVLRGVVSLDDPVSTYLPAEVRVPSRNGREITLLHLATHRSGLPSEPDDMGAAGADGARPYTPEQAYAFLSRHQLRRDPGAAYEYSNFGFALLGHALARAAGVGYPELVRSRILEPLGMDDTGFGDDAGDQLVRGHANGEPAPYRTDWSIFASAGALRSTAPDLLEFMEAHVGPAETDIERAIRVVLDPAMALDRSRGDRPDLALTSETDLDRARRLAAALGAPSADARPAASMAWATVVFPGESPVVAHGGNTLGFEAQVTLIPEKGIGVVLLANDAGFDDDLGTTLLYPESPPEGWSPVAVDSAMLAGYVGEYRSDGGSRYFVRLDPGPHLTYQPEGRVRARLYPTSDSTFYLLRGPWTFTFRATGDSGMAMLMETDEREQDQQEMARYARRVDEATPPPAVAAGNAPPWTGWGSRTWLVLAALGLLTLVLLTRPLWSRQAG